MKKILVVGGAGYIGGLTTDMLINQGFEVTVLDKLLYENRFLKPHSKDKNKNPTQTSGIDTKHKEFLREDKKVIRLTESQLKQIIENIIDEYETIK